MSLALDSVFADIALELNKARDKFPGSRHNMNALTEEVGELAKALLQINYETHKGVTQEDVYWEAIQVASMAIRIATEGDSTLPAYDPESGYRGSEWQGYITPGETPWSEERQNAELVEALEYIADSHDAGRHDGLPEPCPAHDAEEMWAVAREALKASGRESDEQD